MKEIIFISQLNRFFNYGYSGRVDKLAACFHLTLPLKMNVGNMQILFANFKPSTDSTDAFNITLPKYNGKNKIVYEIGNYLHENLKNEIVHAIIHGSIATKEENNYSDFDGLIVLKDEIFESKNHLIHAATHLNKTYKMMLSFDRHQHHGWFVLCEKHLKDWPCSYFPPEIFNHSCSLSEFNTNLKINFKESKHYSKKALINHCNHIIHKLNKNGLPGNIFQLKSLLSEFMLIPSFYIQVKTGKGIFKKNSFAIASNDFSKQDWQIMNEISEIRNQWPAFKRLEINNDHFTPFTRYRQINDGLKLPENITRQLNESFIKRMIQLANLFIQKTNASEIH